MAIYARGRRSLMISMRSGAAFPYTEMVQEWTGAWVHNSEFEAKQPQLTPRPVGADAQALQHAFPPRTEFAVLDLLRADPFETYQAGSPIVNVTLPGNKYKTGDIKRFRGAPGVAGVFNIPDNVNGITGAVIAQAAGYAINIGKYVNGATDTTQTNWFWFSAASNATSAGIGGGFPVGVGPVILKP
jgi:hypothetical protein